MTYLRNNTTTEQWLEDPYTGIKRKVEAQELARVTFEAANRALLSQPGTWELVTPIVPPPS